MDVLFKVKRGVQAPHPTTNNSRPTETPFMAMQRQANVFLIGSRGTGKSTVGRHLAQLLDCEVVDSDDLVEQRAGQTIAQIFTTQGEPAFRDQEEAAIESLCDDKQTPRQPPSKPKKVISLGGGAILRPATRQRLAASGMVVWLTASPATLAQRLQTDPTTAARRPRLTQPNPTNVPTDEDLLSEIEQVLQERSPLYQQCATFVVDTEQKLPTTVAEEIYQQLTANS